MVKLGFRAGWKLPAQFKVPPAVRENAPHWVGASLTDDAVRIIEGATFDLIKARIIARGELNKRTGEVVRTAAEFGPTCERLNEWISGLQALKTCLDRYHRGEINAVAAMLLMDERSSPTVKLPDQERLAALAHEFETLEILAWRALRRLEETHGSASGRDPRARAADGDLKAWISAIVDAVEGVGGKTIEETKRGTRSAPGFGQLIRCLREALPKEAGLKVQTHAAIMLHVRDVLLSRSA